MKYFKYICYALTFFLIFGSGVYAADANNPGDTPKTVGHLYDDGVNASNLTNDQGDPKLDFGVKPNVEKATSHPDVFKENANHVTDTHKKITSTGGKKVFLRQDDTGVEVNTAATGGGTDGLMESPSKTATPVGQDQALVIAHAMSYERARESKFFATAMDVLKPGTTQIKPDAVFMNITIQNNTRDGYLIAISSAGAGHLIPHDARQTVPANINAAGDADNINAKNGELPIPYDLTYEIKVPDNGGSYPEWVKYSLGGLEPNNFGYIASDKLKTGNYLLIGNIMSGARANDASGLNAIESISKTLAMGDSFDNSGQPSEGSLSGKVSKYVYNGLVSGAEGGSHDMSEAIAQDDLFHVVATNDIISNYELSLGYFIHTDHQAYLNMAGTLFERIGVTYIDL